MHHIFIINVLLIKTCKENGIEHSSHILNDFGDSKGKKTILGEPSINQQCTTMMCI